MSLLIIKQLAKASCYRARYLLDGRRRCLDDDHVSPGGVAPTSHLLLLQILLKAVLCTLVKLCDTTKRSSRSQQPLS